MGMTARGGGGWGDKTAPTAIGIRASATYTSQEGGGLVEVGLQRSNLFLEGRHQIVVAFRQPPQLLCHLILLRHKFSHAPLGRIALGGQLGQHSAGN